MDDEELEKIKENLKNAEFNNDKEDLEEMEDVDDKFRVVDYSSLHDEKEEKDEDEEDQVETSEDEEEEIEETESNDEVEITREDDSLVEKKGFNKIIIIICAVIVILLVVIGAFVVPKFFGNSSSKNESYDDEGKITNPKIDVAKGKSSFINNNYLYVIYNDAAYITKLDGTVVYQDDDKACTMMNDSYFMCERSVDSSKVKYVIKKLSDSGTSENVSEEEDFDSNGRIIRSGSKLVGYYSEGKNGTNVTILNNGSIKTIDLDNLYFNKTSDSMTRKIYGGRYIIVSNDKNNNINESKSYSYGVYDVIEEKTLIKPKYDALVYLSDNLFIAVKNGKSGVVDTNDSVKVDFKYDAIEYANGLYFVGKNNTLEILDKNFKTIGDKISVKTLSNYNYYSSKKVLDAKACGDKTILFRNSISGTNQYSIVDQQGKSTDYDFQRYAVAGDRVVTLKDKSLVLYDTGFNKIQEFTVPNDINIDLDTAVIYLQTNLVFNGCYVFDITSGNYLYQMNTLSRSYQGYYVSLHFQNGVGKAEVFLDDKPVGSIEDINISEFLKAENNGISLTNEYFIFHVADKTLVLKR